MPHANGTKKWAVGVLTAIALTFAAWAGASIVGNSALLASHDAQLVVFSAWLKAMDGKLDRLLEERRDR